MERLKRRVNAGVSAIVKLCGCRMKIKPIRTKRDYEFALETVETLMDARVGTIEGDQLNAMVAVIQAYEAKHFPMTSAWVE